MFNPNAISQTGYGEYPDKEPGVQADLGTCIDLAHAVLSSLRTSRAALFPPVPEPVAAGSQSPTSGPPNVTSQVAFLRELLKEAGMISSGIASRL